MAWINDKYQEWRGPNGLGQDAGVSAYARYLGIERSLVDAYLRGTKKPRSKASIDALVRVYGVEVYEALDITPTPGEVLQIQLQRANLADDGERTSQIWQAIEEYLNSIPGMRRVK